MKREKRIILKIAGFSVFLIALYYLTNYVASNESVQSLVQRFGYWGIYIASVISGFNLVVPIPIATFIPLFVESGFGFLPTVLIISLGMTTGDMLSYAVGRLGGTIITNHHDDSNHWFVRKIRHYQEDHPHLPYFILFIFVSFVPIPNEITVLPMGFMGYKLAYIVPIVIIGNLIFNFLTAYGIMALFGVMG